MKRMNLVALATGLMVTGCVLGMDTITQQFNDVYGDFQLLAGACSAPKRISCYRYPKI